LLTAIGLTPGGSSTVHIYIQTVNRTTQNKQYIEQHKTKNTQNKTKQTIHRTTQNKEYTEQHKTNNTQNNTKQAIHRTQNKQYTEQHKANNTKNNTNKKYVEQHKNFGRNVIYDLMK